MKASSIHHINSILILASAFVAFFIPFELFLFSYAVLGPLHYLTEISWLHKKNYFTKGKYDFVFLVIACLLIVYLRFTTANNYNLITDLMTLSLFAAGVFVFIKDNLYRFIAIFLALIIIVLMKNTDNYIVWVSLFLPTIIHVFIFTLAFMLYGVIKERSSAGLLSVIILILTSTALLTIQPEGFQYQVSEYVIQSYAFFSELNYQLINFFKLGELNKVKDIFTDKAGFVIMRFIAFAYTYHYLNWFSKTSVIKWHLVPKKSLIITICLWLVSVAIYSYNYQLGFIVLFLLSLLHVLLEFPLNIVSLTGIGKELISLSKKVRNKKFYSSLSNDAR